ncbi:MAG: hypothetical protein SGPRY_011279 [Prymnesium sp.]
MGEEAALLREGSARPTRVGSIDAIKAFAIVLVVATHSGRPAMLLPSEPSGPERVLSALSSAATPLFLFASGFLSARRPANAFSVGRTLMRLLVPYVLASCVAFTIKPEPLQALSPSHSLPLFTRSWWLALMRLLLSFSVRGVYYYVAIAIGCALLTPALIKACEKRSGAACALLLSGALRLAAHARSGALLPKWIHALSEPQVYMRLPSFGLWAFTFGLSTSLHLDAPLRRLLLLWPRGGGLLLWCGVFCWLSEPHRTISEEQQAARSLASDLMLMGGSSCLMLLLSSATPRGLATHPIVLFLSSCTYTIYLYHILFIDKHHNEVTVPLGVHLLAPEQNQWIPQRTALGLGGGVAVAMVGTGILGTWAPLLLGCRLPFSACGVSTASEDEEELQGCMDARHV